MRKTKRAACLVILNIAFVISLLSSKINAAEQQSGNSYGYSPDSIDIGLLFDATPKFVEELSVVSVENSVRIHGAPDNNALLFLAERLEKSISVPVNISRNEQPSNDITFIFATHGELASNISLQHQSVQDAVLDSQGHPDSFVIVPFSVNGSAIDTIAIVGNGQRDWNYALDMITERIDSSNNLQAATIIDWPDFSERSIIAGDPTASYEAWIGLIDKLARLRFTSMQLKLHSNNEGIVSDFPNLRGYRQELFFQGESPLKDTQRLNDVINYGRLRGIEVVPTITHFSNLRIGEIYPSWTNPNRKALDWRNPELQNFVTDYIEAIFEYTDSSSISIWADEGGSLSGQDNFLRAIKRAITDSRLKHNKDLTLRFLTSPTFSESVATGEVGNLNTALPTNVILDHLSGVTYRGSPGSYHVSTPAPHPGFHPASQLNAGTGSTLVGFGVRAAFTGVQLPFFTHSESLIKSARSNGFSGVTAFVAGTIEDFYLQANLGYLASNLWTEDGVSRREHIYQLRMSAGLQTDDDTFNAYNLWESAGVDVFVALDQQFKMRLDLNRDEVFFNRYLDEARNGDIQLRIDILDSALDKLDQAISMINDSDIQDDVRLVRSVGASALYLFELMKTLSHLESLSRQPTPEELINLNSQILAVELEFENITTLDNLPTRPYTPYATFEKKLQELRSDWGLPTLDTAVRIIQKTLVDELYLLGDGLDESEIATYRNEINQAFSKVTRNLDLLTLESLGMKGWGPFDRSHDAIVSAVFPGATSAQLNARFLDIDNHKEVEILLNGVSTKLIVPKSASSSWGDLLSFELPIDLLNKSGANVISFRNIYGVRSRPHKWGVSDVTINIEEAEFSVSLVGGFAATEIGPDELHQGLSVAGEASLNARSITVFLNNIEVAHTEPKDGEWSVKLSQEQVVGALRIGSNQLTASMTDFDTHTLPSSPFSSSVAVLSHFGEKYDMPAKGTVLGGNGIDFITGSDFDDQIRGGAGNDRLYGTGGADMLYGESGNDRLIGGSGNDDLLGQSGDDVLFGAGGQDFLSGGDGDDILDAGPGIDNLTGGAGADRYIFRGLGGTDTVRGYAAEDIVDLSKLNYLNFDSVLADMEEKTNGTVLHLSSGSNVVFVGRQKEDFNSDNFKLR